MSPIKNKALRQWNVLTCHHCIPVNSPVYEGCNNNADRFKCWNCGYIGVQQSVLLPHEKPCYMPYRRETCRIGATNAFVSRVWEKAYVL